MVERPEFESLWTEVNPGAIDLRIHSLCSKDGPSDASPIIVVPGLGVSGLTMLPTARLMPRERHVLVVDLPGQGESDKPDAALDLPAYAAILADWLEALNFERAVWFGHSFGTQVLVELAVEYPDIVDRLVLVSLTVDPEARSMTSQLARLLLDATREPRPLLRLLARDYRKAGLRTLLEVAHVALGDRIEEKLPSIQAPTLLVCGGRDPFVPEHWARQMAKLVPRSKLVVIPGATHAVQYVAPAELARELQEFLTESATRVDADHEVAGSFSAPPPPS
jgi:2-hydroxy-6-oxonona-2,4-dienedioate hydrolase